MPIPVLTIRSPKAAEGRQSFSILRLERKDGKRKQSTVASKELDRVNADYQAGTLPFESALALVRDIRDRIATKERGHRQKPITLQENLRLLDAYWKAEYQYRDLADPETMRYDLMRALRVVGSISLLTADDIQIYERIKKSGLAKNGQRRITLRLNQLLRFAGRPFRLRMPREDFLNVRYLNTAEVFRLADHLGGIARDLVLVAFSTGARLGEIFAITPTAINDKGHVYISSQIKRDGSKSLPKTRRTRQVKTLLYGVESLKAWAALPMNQRQRQRHWNEVVKKACRELWPDDKEKHCHFHDLRHSFAIEMCRLGQPVDRIAKLLGNSTAVCEKYYTGFSVKKESLEALDAEIDAKIRAETKARR